MIDTPVPPGAELAAALAERDRRAAETASLIAGGAAAVIRLSARLPAALRERGLAEAPVERGSVAFETACRERGIAIEPAGSGRGALGPWRLWVSGAEAASLKRAALAVEEGSWLGRLLDLDVASDEGPVGRAALGLPPRPCAVCDGPAAVCAGRAAHAPSELAAAFEAIAKLAYAPMQPDLRPGAPSAPSRS